MIKKKIIFPLFIVIAFGYCLVKTEQYLEIRYAIRQSQFTKNELIDKEAFRPNILAKNNKYTEQSILNSEICKISNRSKSPYHLRVNDQDVYDTTCDNHKEISILVSKVGDTCKKFTGIEFGKECFLILNQIYRTLPSDLSIFDSGEEINRKIDYLGKGHLIRISDDILIDIFFGEKYFVLIFGDRVNRKINRSWIFLQDGIDIIILPKEYPLTITHKHFIEILSNLRL